MLRLIKKRNELLGHPVFLTSATTPGAVFITFHFLVSFFSWFVLIYLYMSIQFCAIDCIFILFPCNLANTGIQLNSVYTLALRSSRSLPSFGIRVVLGMLHDYGVAPATESYFLPFSQQFLSLL